jgi:hypothetical protein
MVILGDGSVLLRRSRQALDSRTGVAVQVGDSGNSFFPLPNNATNDLHHKFQFNHHIDHRLINA